MFNCPKQICRGLGKIGQHVSVYEEPADSAVKTASKDLAGSGWFKLSAESDAQDMSYISVDFRPVKVLIASLLRGGSVHILVK